MARQTRTGRTPLEEDVNTAACWSVETTTRTCPQCKKKYEHRVSAMDYISDFDGVVLCSYNCRCNYYKAHEKERAEWLYKQSWEYKYEKFQEVQRKCNQKYKERKKAKEQHNAV